MKDQYLYQMKYRINKVPLTQSYGRLKYYHLPCGKSFYLSATNIVQQEIQELNYLHDRTFGFK